jgi:hypothetical protein
LVLPLDKGCGFLSKVFQKAAPIFRANGLAETPFLRGPFIASMVLVPATEMFVREAVPRGLPVNAS